MAGADCVMRLTEIRSTSQAEYSAMVSRGYTGNARTLVATRIRAVDVTWLLACVALAAAVVLGDRSLGA